MPTITANSLTLYYEIHGSGPPLLFITGVAYDHWFWHEQVAALHNHFQVIVFDNRGAGKSDKPPGPYSSAEMARDTVGLLDALGLERAHVVGHSLGGFIAQELALAHPDRIDRLVLAGTSHGGPDAIPITPEALDVLTHREGDPQELLRRGIAIATAPGFPERNPALFQAILDYRRTAPVAPAEYAAQVSAGVGHDASDRIHRITAPVLCLAGEHDRVVPPGNAALMAAKLSRAQVQVIQGAGHLFPLEAPEATNRALLAFLAATRESL